MAPERGDVRERLTARPSPPPTSANGRSRVQAGKSSRCVVGPRGRVAFAMFSDEDDDEDEIVSRGGQWTQNQQTKGRRRIPRHRMLILISAILVPILTRIESISCSNSQQARFTIISPPQSPQAAPPLPQQPLVGPLGSAQNDDWARRLRPPSTPPTTGTTARTTTTTTTAGGGGARMSDRQDEALLQHQAYPEDSTPANLMGGMQQFQQQQQGPLARALEATRMFIRQQQQVPSLLPQSRFPLLQTLVNASNGLAGQAAVATQAMANAPQQTGTTGRLMQFLFQPRPAPALGGSPATSSVAMKPSMRQFQEQASKNSSAKSTRTGHEPFQLASSENSYEHAAGSGSSWASPRATSATGNFKGGRSIVTLSAPYEQKPRVLLDNRTQTSVQSVQARKRPANDSNLITSASGNHLTRSLGGGESYLPVESPGESASPYESMKLAGETQSNGVEQEPGEQFQPTDQDPNQEQQQQFVLVQQEDEQPQGQAQAKWEGANEVGQDQQQQQQVEVVHQVVESEAPNSTSEAAEQQANQHQHAQQVDESTQLPGEEAPQQHEEHARAPQQLVRIPMSGDVYGGGGGGEDQRRPNETFLQLYEQPEPNANSSAGTNSEMDLEHDHRGQLANLTTSYLLPVGANESELSTGPVVDSTANLQSDESLLAAQLPSQYDSMIRVPPEGHYDDYFKPTGGGAGEQAASAALLTRDSPLVEFRVPQNGTSAHQQHHMAELIQQQQQQHDEGNRTTNDTYQQYFVPHPQQPQQQQQQQPERPQTIFMTPNRTVLASDFNQAAAAAARQREPRNHQRPHEANYSHPMQHEGRHQLQQKFALMGQQQQQQQQAEEVYQIVVQNQSAQHHVLVPAGNSNASLGGEDNIQLIVANSAGQQDPNTNEKVITYTSEAGKNFARLVGKPARQTFFNKDLNESPPAPVQATGGPSAPAPGQPSTTQQPELMMLTGVRVIRSTRAPHAPRPAQPAGPAAPSSRPAQQQQQRHLVAAAGTAQPMTTSWPSSSSPSSTQRSDELEAYEEPADENETSEPHEDEDELARQQQHGQFGQYAPGQQQQAAAPSGRSERNDRGRGGHARPPVARQPDDLRAPRNYRLKPSHSNVNKMHMTNHQHQRGHKGHHQTKHQLHKQQTMGRPQVTEAKFELKDLALNAPTAMPSVGESTVKSISELPVKAKRVRDKQVDKNELMNELLTALDRVKAAIYKLQPLTAKMNAMYRKSVTSNTRDHIMDNHKGTYSKRYPPGDYDDTYDRMHPSELLEHQQRLGGGGGSADSRSSRRRPTASSSGSSGAATPTISRRRRNHRTGGGRAGRNGPADEVEASDSRAAPVYVPAPRELLQSGAWNGTSLNGTLAGLGTRNPRNATGQRSSPPPDEIERRLGESRIVASGFGRRGAGSRRIRGRLSLSSPLGGEQILYDDDDDQGELSRYDLGGGAGLGGGSVFSKRSGDHLRELIRDENLNATRGRPGEESDDESGPLFGYRITIYQSPELGDGSLDSTGDPQTDEANKILSYSLLADDQDEDQSTGVANSPEGEDLMATSESSLVPTNRERANDPEVDQDDSSSSSSPTDQDDPAQRADASEPKSMRKKMSAKKEESHEKEKGDKKGNKWSKHHARGKKGEEEHKKKKEFKKIKHHKGLMSKESHKLHRDKHIKAHDRGAAKEKALKERTQIEFFEREQIVDDEYEKGKKSTVKAGWASGHDAKKSSLEVGGGGHHGDYDDSMSMGGSNFVRHLESPPPQQPAGSAASASAASPMLMAASEHSHEGHNLKGKGHGHSSELSSGKQSNKYEKKHMEAKGKKFKGWREKGYKIITETEFIDRGSLHDSAYKKRDKGAAHHQKFKKHEAKSEGHHGSMHEHHKKSHKKDEKKFKMGEKKKEMMGKEAAEKKAEQKKKKVKEQKAKKAKKEEEGEDHDQEESAPTMSSLGDTGLIELARDRPPSSSGQPAASTLRPTILTFVGTTSTTPGPVASSPFRQNTTLAPSTMTNQTRLFGGADPVALARHRYVLATSSDRRSDLIQPTANKRRPSTPQTQNSNSSTANHLLFNATLLDIIDRLNVSRSFASGRQESPMAKLSAIKSSQERARADANSSPLLRLVNSLAKFDNHLQDRNRANPQQQPRRDGGDRATNLRPSQAQAQMRSSGPPAARQAIHEPRQAPPARIDSSAHLLAPTSGTFDEPDQPPGVRFGQTSGGPVSTREMDFAKHFGPHSQGAPREGQFSAASMEPQRQEQFYLQPPGAYLPPLQQSVGQAQNFQADSSAFSFMAEPVQSPFAAALGPMESFDYELPVDSQQQFSFESAAGPGARPAPSLSSGAFPSEPQQHRQQQQQQQQLQFQHMQHFNFLTD